MNLILCGMMGCGKSTIGALLAKEIGYTFVDSDAVIVEKYGEIAKIFNRFGEEYFRDLETETVKMLVQRDRQVLALGGGAVLREENVRHLKTSGRIVFLRAKKETLLPRLQSDRERPLLQTEKSLFARLDELLEKRAPIYEQVADFTVDVDGKIPEGIVTEIVKRIGQV